MFNESRHESNRKSQNFSSTVLEGSFRNNGPNYEQNKDNSRGILEKLANLYEEKNLSDIVLCVGHLELTAHRLILCASSEVFQIMLMNPEWSESRENKIRLQEAPECVEVFERFLRYLYIGQMTFSHDTVLPILGLADKYNVKDLIGLCISYMIDHLVSAAKIGYLFSWLQYSVTSGHKDIEDACINHLKWNFEVVAKSEEFGFCELALLTSVLSHHDLVVHDEMTLYNYVVLWLHRQEERLLSTPSAVKENQNIVEASMHSKNVTNLVKEDCSHLKFKASSQPSINQSKKKYYIRRESNCSSSDSIDQMEFLTQEVMRFVRFPMMTPRQLADLLLVPLTIKYKEFFVTRMAIGMSFHSGHWDRIQEVMLDPDSANKLLFTPRLYTADHWGACMAIDNLPTLPSYCKRTLVFSTPASASEIETCDSQLEWIVELFPKGVWFKKFFLIVWHGTFELPETILKTVRLSITAKDAEHARVRIAVLIFGMQDGIEHIVNVVSTTHIFTAEDSLLNMDDILPYDLLNHKLEGYKYLLDPTNSLKIHVVISPLPDPNLR